MLEEPYPGPARGSGGPGTFQEKEVRGADSDVFQCASPQAGKGFLPWAGGPHAGAPNAWPRMRLGSGRGPLSHPLLPISPLPGWHVGACLLQVAP